MKQITHLSSGQDDKNPPPNCVTGTETDVWPSIYQPNTNIMIWHRQLTDSVTNYATWLLEQSPLLCQMTTPTTNVANDLGRLLPEHSDSAELAKDIALLTDMFCYLFELERVGLRLATLDSAMCPRFHVDYVPCRLVTTYAGAGTEWLGNESVDRLRLGRGSVDADGNRLEVFSNERQIYRASTGEVALLKGENWEGNEGNGLVHRSPPASPYNKRLVLTLDFA